MVWNSTQQSLYCAVECYNRSISEERCCENTDPEPKDERDCSRDFNPEKSDKPRKPESPPKPKPKPVRNPNPLAELLSDRDTLLIAGLIFILIHEKADMKLVGALVLLLIG